MGFYSIKKKYYFVDGKYISLYPTKKDREKACAAYFELYQFEEKESKRLRLACSLSSLPPIECLSGNSAEELKASGSKVVEDS